MRTAYEVTLFVHVEDLPALRAEAERIYRENVTNVTDEDIAELLDLDGKPDPAACLRMVLDPGISPPGISIQDSTVSDGTDLD